MSAQAEEIVAAGNEKVFKLLLLGAGETGNGQGCTHKMSCEPEPPQAMHRRYGRHTRLC